MPNQQDEIREAILLRAYETWADGNPFSDIVDRRFLLDDLEDEIGEDVDLNDVKYTWKLMTEDGYFRQRGKSRRIWPREVDEVAKMGVETEMEQSLQQEILTMLTDAEKQNVDHPEVPREQVLETLTAPDEIIDKNMWYVGRSGLAEVTTYIQQAPWNHAEIQPAGRQ